MLADGKKITKSRGVIGVLGLGACRTRRGADARVDAEGGNQVRGEGAVEAPEGEEEAFSMLVPAVLVVEGGGAVPVLVDGRLHRLLTALQRGGIVGGLVLVRAVQEERIGRMERVRLREVLLETDAVEVDGLPGGQQLWGGGPEAGVVELEQVEGPLALLVVHGACLGKNKTD